MKSGPGWQIRRPWMADSPALDGRFADLISVVLVIILLVVLYAGVLRAPVFIYSRDSCGNTEKHTAHLVFGCCVAHIRGTMDTFGVRRRFGQRGMSIRWERAAAGLQ